MVRTSDESGLALELVGADVLAEVRLAVVVKALNLSEEGVALHRGVGARKVFLRLGRDALESLAAVSAYSQSAGR